MVFLTSSSLSALAIELRELCGEVCSLVAELDSAGQWSGNDADHFTSDFNELVRDKLYTAAALLDTLAVIH